MRSKHLDGFRHSHEYPRFRLLLLILFAVAIRLVFFTGLSVGDDVFYELQAIAHAQGSWPPAPYHWQTRIGVTLPTSLVVAVVGLKPIAFVCWPLFASTVSVLVTYVIAKEFADLRTAWLAAVFHACYPLDLIYATHLFPDVLVALFTSLSLWRWMAALRTEKVADYLGTGCFFAAGYLCRETVFMLVPVYAALLFHTRQLWRPRVLLAATPVILVFATEALIYFVTAGTPAYRLNAILAQQQSGVNLALIHTSTAGGNFWVDPLLMLAFNQEFALYQIAALLATIYAVRAERLTPLAIWWIVGFLWTYYGSTVPDRFVPLQRDPRYAASLTTPAVIIIAWWLYELRSTATKGLAVTLVLAGVASSALDLGRSPLTAHGRFVQNNTSDSVALEPFEYFAARWTTGLERTVRFKCLSDTGRQSVVDALRALHGVQMSTSDLVMFVAFAPSRRPDLLEHFQSRGWKIAEEFPADARWLRRLVGRVLALIPSQEERSHQVIHPPGLLVLRNPSYDVAKSQP